MKRMLARSDANDAGVATLAAGAYRSTGSSAIAAGSRIGIGHMDGWDAEPPAGTETRSRVSGSISFRADFAPAFP